MKGKEYNYSIDDVITGCDSKIEGLKENEAQKRLEENGYNKLKEGKKKSLFAKFIDQFKNVMIIILLIAAAISAVVAKIEGESMTDVVVILLVVLLNAILGVAQESKAEKAIEALKKMSLPFIKVRRNGMIVNVKTEELVVGDIVLIEAGDFVPADMRIIVNNSLRVEEAALTGESVPVDKTDSIISGEVALAERKNMLYSGSSVVYGRGEGIVVATGMKTELGKIAAILTESKEEITPLQRKLNEISKVLSIIVVIIGLIMVVTGVLRNNPILEVFMLAVSLAVAAIPEGLPAAITIILSIGVQKMAKENSIVRKLSSVETLGSTEIICSDKTGTLTQNRMTVKEICIGTKLVSDPYDIGPETEQDIKLIHTMVLCNDTKYGDEDSGRVLLGDPTETALVSFAEKFSMGKDKLDKEFNRKGEIPFDSDRKMMTTICRNGDGFRAYTKGATESVLDRCSHAVINDERVKLSAELKANILSSNDNMSKRALRVLAFAIKDMDKIPEKLESKEVENGLTYMGLVGMIDPPRPEAKAAVEKCFEAGMVPVMITGDNKETAVAIATELGIITEGSLAITGAELDKMSDEEFESKINNIRVYARVSPENKVRIVKIWKRLGKTVAMTGDGVNDAPALKSADIGIGMGITGTEVSKSVSSIILTDDNFATIVVAIKEGRRIYTNIQNVIAYLLASNLAEVIIIFFGTIFGHTIMKPLQLLWINLVSDAIPAITLGFEKEENNIMKEKPRNSKEKFFNPFLTTRIMVPAIIKSILVLVAFLFVESKYNGAYAMTVAFISLTFMELLFANVCRSDRRFIAKIGFASNKPILIGTIVTILLQLVVIFVPSISNIFQISIMPKELYIFAIALSIVFALIAEITKVVIAKIFKKV